MMLLDSLLCFLAPSLARWTVVVIDPQTGEGSAIPSARFRWRSSAERWARQAVAQWAQAAIDVRFEPRALPPGWRFRLD